MKIYGEKNKYVGKETSLQTSCYKICKHIPGNPLVFHVANERKTSVGWGNALKAQGVVPGIPDLLLCHARGQWHGLAVELKVKGGRLEDHQRYVLDWFEREGWFVALVWSIDGFVELKDEYFGIDKKIEQSMNIYLSDHVVPEPCRTLEEYADRKGIRHAHAYYDFDAYVGELWKKQGAAFIDMGLTIDDMKKIELKNFLNRVY